MLRLPGDLITLYILQDYRCVRLSANRRSIPDVSRRERIVVLLDHYHDVQRGLWDGRADGGGVPLMCSVWNTPAYQRLEVLLRQLRRAEPRAWRAVYATYSEPSFRRRAWCSSCDGVAPPEHVGGLHTHGRTVTVLHSRMVRVPLLPVEDVDVDIAVDWLEAHWAGGVFVPTELLGVAAVVRSK
jgi:hypothetical protein